MKGLFGAIQQAQAEMQRRHAFAKGALATMESGLLDELIEVAGAVAPQDAGACQRTGAIAVALMSAAAKAIADHQAAEHLADDAMHTEAVVKHLREVAASHTATFGDEIMGRYLTALIRRGGPVPPQAGGAS